MFLGLIIYITSWKEKEKLIIGQNAFYRYANINLLDGVKKKKYILRGLWITQKRLPNH